MKHLHYLIIAISIILSACEKDPEDPDAPQTNDNNEVMSCSVRSMPASANYASLYTQYINCTGIPVIAPDGVPEQALRVGDETIEFMLTGLDEVKNKLIERGEYYILFGPGKTAQELPEFINTTVSEIGVYWDMPGAGASTAAGLLCFAEDNPSPNHNIMVHEMVHMVDISGLRLLDSDFESELSSAYNNARSQGLWNNTYAMTNKEEYLAECVMIYYEVHFPFGPPGGDGNSNDIITRAQLQNYDPTIYNIIASRFNSSFDVPGCIQRNEVIPYEDESITCPSTITDADGNSYPVVRIGNQCWIAENLRTTKYKDGSPIDHVSDSLAWISTNSGAYAYYRNDISNQQTYGNLYNWFAITHLKGICPDGWRVPVPDDWQTLKTHLQSIDEPTGGPLKSRSLWDAPNDGATNSTGFNAVPSGIREDDGHFTGKGHANMFFTNFEESATEAKTYNLWSNGDFLNSQTHNKKKGTSCRCIKE
ncbi:MAG: FISUMP domain-containing protein [Chitinophagales bacterium]